jgi:hypothetical protein
VSSKVPTGRRVELLKEFRQAKSAVVTNARCLTEGVDVPNVDAVLFADPRRSTVDIVQAVGRALRKNQSKPGKIGYVLLPVLVEDGQSLEEFLDSSAFKEVGRVLATLSTHDERIAEEFRASEVGSKVGPGQESRIVFARDLPVGVRVNAREFAQKCGAKVWARVGRVNWASFGEARDWVRNLGLRGQAEWRSYCAGRLGARPTKPSDLPSHPHVVYRDNGWRGYGDWLGTARVATQQRRYRPFSAAREFVHSLNLATRSDWNAFCRSARPDLGVLPPDIPAAAAKVYRSQGWKSWGDWLGTHFVASYNRRFRSFKAARNFVRKLKLKSAAEWRLFYKGQLRHLGYLPQDIPTNPNITYASSGWVGFGDWLGTGRVADRDKKYRPFAQAHIAVKPKTALCVAKAVIPL